MGNTDDLVQPITEFNPGVPEELDELVRQCLKYKPEARPESMESVYRALKTFERAYK